MFFEGVSHYVEPTVDISTYTMGVCDLRLLDNGSFQVTLRRPGLLIGKGGRTIDQLEKVLGVKVKIVEKIIEWGSNPRNISK